MLKILLIIATFYSNSFNGKKTASGQLFNQNNYTCATLMHPIGTKLIITYKDKSVLVVVNDRCKRKNIIDLSKFAFRQLSSLTKGKIKVNVKLP